MFKVGIDTGPLKSGHKIRGVGAYTKHLINSLQNAAKTDISIQTADFGANSPDQYDLIHIPYFHPFQRTFPKFSSGQKVVVTIHDLIQLIYPEIYQPGLKGRLNFLMQKRALKKVDCVIVPSETSKKDVVRFLNIEPEKVEVIYEGVNKIYRKIDDKTKLKKIIQKYNLPDRYVLYVGDVNYNKNIPTLLKACIKLGLPLVIAGKQALEVSDAGISLMNLEGPRDYYRFLFNIPHPELKHYSELSDDFEKHKKLVYRLGYISDDDLTAVYSLAELYVQPSFYEGFGLPVLEAFACEVPVIVSKTNCLVEIAGNDILNFNPNDPDELAKKIKMVLQNTKYRGDLVKAGAKRVKEFSWTKCAEQTLSVYDKLLH